MFSFVIFSTEYVADCWHFPRKVLSPQDNYKPLRLFGAFTVEVVLLCDRHFKCVKYILI
jgi:hypothetical protein